MHITTGVAQKYMINNRGKYHIYFDFQCNAADLCSNVTYVLYIHINSSELQGQEEAVCVSGFKPT